MVLNIERHGDDDQYSNDELVKYKKMIKDSKNDCILYRGPENEDLEKCPICGLDRFNHRKDSGDDENCNRNKRKRRA
jgi:hypothetical protein